MNLPFPHLLLHLVGMDSRNPELVPDAPGEREIASYCVEWFQQHGVEAWLDEVAPGRFNSVARIDGGPGRTLAMCAHLDTVSTEGMEHVEPRIEGKRLYGRGAYDMKGGVAAIMAAIAELAADPPAGTVYAALVCDEEYASIGAMDFVQRYPCDACIVTEPSDGQLVLAHKGFVWAEIETHGVAAHGSRWADGQCAIARMGRIITAIDEYDRTTLRSRTHPLLGPASMHCSTISGGDGWSTYASQCVLRVERRTLPGESPAQVIDELRQVASDAGVHANVREIMSRSPLECPPDSTIAVAVRDAVRETTGAAPDIAGVSYWMDAAIFADAGAATVDYGPTGAGAHSAVEWVDLESVETCARVLVDAASRYLS